MKNTLYIPLILLSICLGCSSETKELRSKSPDKSAEIIIDGTKAFLGPWDLTITKVKKGKTDQVSMEMYADDITPENIRFIWNDNNTCTLSFTERDNTIRNLEVIFE